MTTAMGQNRRSRASESEQVSPLKEQKKKKKTTKRKQIAEVKENIRSLHLDNVGVEQVQPPTSDLLGVSCRHA
jgi:hypothetical protein